MVNSTNGGIIPSIGIDLNYRLIFMLGDIVVADKIEYASSLWQKGIGLLGRRTLSAGEGMWLPNVSSIHTIGLKVPIDVLYLDKDFRQTLAVRGLRPMRFCIAPSGTRHCLELTAGTLSPEQCRSSGAQWRLDNVN